MVASVVVPYALLQLTSRAAELKETSDLVGPSAPVAALPGAPSGSNFLYLLAGLTSLATLVYIVLFRKLRERPEVQAYIQFGGDLLLISGLVYSFGGISSPFSLFYLITIAIASSLLRRRAGTAVATAAYVLYAALLLGLFFHWLPPYGGTPPAEPASIWRLTYNLAVHLFGFYAVALLVSLLAERSSEAERALAAKREEVAALQVVHRDIVQSISSGLVTVDLDDRITSVNRSAEEILGVAADDLVGRSIETSGLFTIDEWRLLAAACAQQQRVRDEIERRRGDAATYLGYSLSQLKDAEGHGLGFILAFQDLTDFRALQDEVRLKDRMAGVGELAAGIAHEIGNPLAAISGSAQMLAGSFTGEPGQLKLVEILLKESQRLDRTIQGFLKFARPKERSSVAFDVARLLAENVELLRNSEEVSPQHRVELELEPESARIVADPDQVSQIFWNLARNALRAMPGGGTLRLRGTLAGPTYRLEVVDTGRGMSEEERARLFQPFKSSFQGGAGIGMAIVYRIVEEHGGRILVESRPQGGSRIGVELPTRLPLGQPERVTA